MNRKYTARFVAILVVFGLWFHAAEAARLCGRVFQKQVQSIDQILQGETRPTADDIISFSASEKRRFFDSTQRQEEPQVFAVLADVAREVVNNWDGRPIILLGRDSELIYDALQYLFISSGTPAAVMDRVFLLTLSRPMMANSSYSQLRAYFKTNTGIDLTQVVQGKQKFRIFDTGNRGTIYLNLLNAILGQIKNKDPEWKTKILNALQSIDWLLLATEDANTLPAVIDTIKAMRQFDRNAIYDLFDKEQDSLFFPQIVVADSENRRLIPKDLDSRYDWVVDNIEYKPHWEGRTLGLSENGKDRVLPLENDKRVNKPQYLARQIALFDFMAKSPEVQEMVEAFAKRAGRVKPLPRVEANVGSVVASIPSVPLPKPVLRSEVKSRPAVLPKPTPAPVTKVAVQKRIKVVIGQDYASGDVVDLNGQAFTIVNKLGSGSKGIVYRVQSVADKSIEHALKIAKYNDEETLDSFRRERRKQEAYVQAQVRHSSIVSEGDVWILKTLIAGQRADAWLKEWDTNSVRSTKMNGLIRFFRSMSARGVYIGDLNPTNLVWNDNQWTIIDSGGARMDYGESKTLKRFYEKTKDRWHSYFPSKDSRRAFKEALGVGLLGQSE